VAAGTFDELPTWTRELLDTARVAHLGLLDGDGRPRVLPITFAFVDGAAWTVVDDKPKRREGEQLARVRWLRARPHAAVTVDHYEDDWTRLAWVQLIGDVSVLEPAGQQRVMKTLAARYEPYRRQPPRGPLLQLVPQRILYWRSGVSPP
jgi:PPOX class probable F420-dependent enzyme